MKNKKEKEVDDSDEPKEDNKFKKTNPKQVKLMTFGEIIPFEKRSLKNRIKSYFVPFHFSLKKPQFVLLNLN